MSLLAMNRAAVPEDTQAGLCSSIAAL
ncbi:hypothetical protein EMIT0232MI5_220033 [Pseudomonas sp. IT-232MI5]